MTSDLQEKTEVKCKYFLSIEKRNQMKAAPYFTVTVDLQILYFNSKITGINYTSLWGISLLNKMKTG